MSTRVTRVLCAAHPRGSGDAIAHLLAGAERHDVHVVALVGDLSGGAGATDSYRSVFRALGEGGLPAYWVPGPNDAPIGAYLREAHNMEVVFPFLRGVHGTAAFAPDGHVVVAGLGGEVSDDPDAERDEIRRLRYPRWEAEYRLKVINELAEHELAMAFATPPAHKGRGEQGSEVLAELINTYRPRLVVCGGERTSEMLGRTMVVAPGSLLDGHYAVVDLHAKEVDLQQLAATAG